MTVNSETLTEALRQQVRESKSPAEAVSAVLTSLQIASSTRRENTQTPLSAVSQAVTAVWAAMSLVEYARLLRPYSQSAMELVLALYAAIIPHPSAIEMCWALLDDHVYPQTGKEEMRSILNACGYSDTDISQALNACFPDSKAITVEVQAGRAWQNTGACIGAGEKAIIEYQSGTWSISPAIPNCGASGSSSHIAKNGYAMPNKPEGGLIGRIGGTVFWAGKYGETPLGIVGELQLCPNDDLQGVYGAGLKDNSGSVKVKITVIRR
ncbi:MAG: hypothetical protein PHN64_08475 [Desulfovibrionaceae bacterium]|nr:hypothetical protein [Desulfovibrionaceae bacterium]